jgi:hypothetical protein
MEAARAVQILNRITRPYFSYHVNSFPAIENFFVHERLIENRDADLEYLTTRSLATVIPQESLGLPSPASRAMLKEFYDLRNEHIHALYMQELTLDADAKAARRLMYDAARKCKSGWRQFFHRKGVLESRLATANNTFLQKDEELKNHEDMLKHKYEELEPIARGGILPDGTILHSTKLGQFFADIYAFKNPPVTDLDIVLHYKDLHQGSNPQSLLRDPAMLVAQEYGITTADTALTLLLQQIPQGYMLPQRWSELQLSDVLQKTAMLIHDGHEPRLSFHPAVFEDTDDYTCEECGGSGYKLSGCYGETYNCCGDGKQAHPRKRLVKPGEILVQTSQYA